MKIRNDFVSNSSSSSYIIAVNNLYSLKQLSKDIAKATVNKNDTYHDPQLYELNLQKLNYCLSTYQLVWLGDLVIGKERKVMNLHTLADIYDDDKLAQQEWKRLVSQVKKVNDSPASCDKWLLEMYKDTTYDQMHDEIVQYEDISISGPVLVSDDIECSFFYSGVEDETTIAKRVNALVKLAKKCWRGNDCKAIDMYQITKRTISNTRCLMNAGYKIDFSDTCINKTLDELEKMIDAGDKLLYIRQAHGGDGYGDTYIYCEDSARGISDVNGVEVVGGECM